MDTPADIQTQDATHVLATWHDTLIQIWWGTSTGEAVSNQTRVARAFMAARSTPTQLLLIVEPTCPPPIGKALEEFIRFSRDLVPQMSTAVAVTEGGGFRAAIVRSVAASIALALPRRIPYVFVDNVEAGAALLAPHLPRGSGGADLVRAVEALRARVGPARARS